MTEAPAQQPSSPPPPATITAADVMALIWAMRGLVQAGEVALPDWQRFLDIHLAGLRAVSRPG